MRPRIILALCLLITNVSPFLGEGAARAAPVEEPKFSIFPIQAPEGHTTRHFEMGNTLAICATGKDNLTKIEAELKKPAPSQALALYFDGERMTGLPIHAVREPGCKDGMVLEFELVRDPNDNENRKAWDEFFGRYSDYVRHPSVYLAIDSATADAVSSDKRVEFAVAPETWIYSVLTICVLLLCVGFFLLVRNPSILRDSPGGPYSLGKSQMAFWGLLVVLAFTGVWAITGTMERIPPQVLILLGISAGTGLGAIMIGASNKVSQKADLEKEQADLQEKKAALGATFPPESQARMNKIPGELQELNAPTPKSSPNSFLSDICNDGQGMSFHRLQVVIWTLVLGAVFIRAVSGTCSMPEFPETLLVLMGISGGTYLGFKLPEKQQWNRPRLAGVVRKLEDAAG